MDDGFIDKIWSSATFLAGIFAVNVVALFRIWPLIMQRLNERRRDTEDAKASDWGRLRKEIERLDERCDGLQKEVAACREREGEWMSRAILAEGMLQGLGEVRQVEAIRAAYKHLGKPE